MTIIAREGYSAHFVHSVPGNSRNQEIEWRGKPQAPGAWIGNTYGNDDGRTVTVTNRLRGGHNFRLFKRKTNATHTSVGDFLRRLRDTTRTKRHVTVTIYRSLTQDPSPLILLPLILHP